MCLGRQLLLPPCARQFSCQHSVSMAPYNSPSESEVFFLRPKESRAVLVTIVVLGLVGSAYMLGRSTTVASAGSPEAVKLFDGTSTCDEISSWASGSHGVHGGNYAHAESVAKSLKAMNCVGTPSSGAANTMCIGGPCNCGAVTCQKGSYCNDGQTGCVSPAACTLQDGKTANAVLPCACLTQACTAALSACDPATPGKCAAPA